MELLYLIDRTITRILQVISKFAERRLHINLNLQSLFLLLLSFLVYMLIAVPDLYSNLLGRHWNDFSITSSGLGLGSVGILVIYSLVLIILNIIAKLIAIMILKKLHRFFDPEGEANPDKLYTDGNKAWAKVVVGIIFLIIGIKEQIFLLSIVFIYLGTSDIIQEATMAFIERRKSNTKREKRGVTEALRKLLDKCKAWLPNPLPRPGI